MALAAGSDRRGDGRGDRGDGAAQDDAGRGGNHFFHQRLSPYGRWDTRAGYGEVWRPRVAAGWRPYTTGHWVYTDYGWTWAADESWGWAPFHYGRWYQDADLGWGWVPGNVWAPAWVDWRNGGGYVGWAALPPEVGFTAGVGVSLGGLALVSSSYCFVSERAILEPRLATFIVAPTRNVEILRGAANINGVAVVNNRVFNQGMSVQRVEQVTGRAVPRVRVGSQAAFYRPAAVANAARQTRSESFVNRPAPRAASAGVRSVPTATHGANGHNSGGIVARSHTAVATPPQHRTQRSAATTPPQHRAQRAAARTNLPPRHVAGASQPQHASQRSSARPSPPPRHVAAASQPQHGTQRSPARPSPPPRHVAAAPQHAGHAPAQANPRRQPPPPSSRQPQVQKLQPLP
jgi:hypothetical protein